MSLEKNATGLRWTTECYKILWISSLWVNNKYKLDHPGSCQVVRINTTNFIELIYVYIYPFKTLHSPFFVSVHKLLHLFSVSGNKTTLDIEPKANNICTRDELLKFHGKFYSSNVMALAILGREPLDQLSEMATRMFSDIENKNVTVPVYEESPFTAEELKVCTHIIYRH